MVKAGDEIMDEGMDEVGNELMDDGWRNAIEIIVEEATDELQAKALANPQGRPLSEHDRLEVRFTEDADSGLLVESEKKTARFRGCNSEILECVFFWLFSCRFLDPIPYCTEYLMRDPTPPPSSSGGQDRAV